MLPLLTPRGPIDAPRLADALSAAGLGAIEVTLRDPSAWAVLAALIEDGRLRVGAGTVLTTEQVRRCVDLGAAFLVSPGLDEAIVEAAHVHGVPVLPGVATPGEAQRALGMGLTQVKLFPAQLVGGVAMVRALAGPFPDLRLLPSGGIGEREVRAYLTEPNVLAVAGSWMLDPGALEAGDWHAVETACRSAVAE